MSISLFLQRWRPLPKIGMLKDPEWKLAGAFSSGFDVLKERCINRFLKISLVSLPDWQRSLETDF